MDGDADEPRGHDEGPELLDSELEDQRKLWKLLDPERNIGVSLTSADQMVPEQSTSAIVLHHPEAVYYTVKGAVPGA